MTFAGVAALACRLGPTTLVVAALVAIPPVAVHAQDEVAPPEGPPVEAPPQEVPTAPEPSQPPQTPQSPAEAPPPEAPPPEAPPPEAPPAEAPSPEAPPPEASPPDAPPPDAPPPDAPPPEAPAQKQPAAPAEGQPQTSPEQPAAAQPAAATAVEPAATVDPFAQPPSSGVDSAEPGWGDDGEQGQLDGGGEDGWGDDDDSAGFGGDDDDSAQPAEPETIPGELSASAFVRQMAALWVNRLDRQPLSRARQSADFSLRYKKPFATSEGRALLRIVADMHFEYDFAYLADRELYDEATLDTYEYQMIGGESFIALSYGRLDLIFGRQIVAWGHGEMLSPVDIVNPRDSRDPAIAELDDIRMAVLASRAALFFGQQRLELMVIHESYFGLRPAPMSDLSPVRGLILDDPQLGALLGNQELRSRDVPGRFDSQASQVLGRWTYAGSGIDLALYAASTLDKQGVGGAVGADAIGPDGITMDQYHPRYTMLGHAGARPWGDYIFRWEAGVDLDRPLSATDTSSDNAFDIEAIKRTQLNWMLGTSYAGITDGTLSIEYQQGYVIDSPDRDSTPMELLLSPEQPIFAASYRHNFLRETLMGSAVVTMLGLSDFRGLMAKAGLTYEVADGIKIGAGYAMFVPADDKFGPFYGFDSHDRVYATTRWDFLLE